MPRRTHTPLDKRDRNPTLFSSAKLASLFAEIPSIDSEKINQLLAHWRLLISSPDRSDLTRLTRADDIALKHYLDCALPLKFIKLPSPLLDIGSGAGFPGLVLKILSPETEIILGEVKPKRVRFLEEAIKFLGLKNVTVFAHRIGPQFPLEIQGVVTRALESARDSLYRVQSFLPAGGKVILLKGPQGSREIIEALNEMPDFAHEKTFSYALANTQHEREMIIFTRKSESLRTKNVKIQTPSQSQRLEITSRANEQFKMLLSLSEARGIKKNKLYLVSGEKLVSEILQSEKLRTGLSALVVDADFKTQLPARVIALASVLFRELDIFGTRQPLALMQLPEIKTWDDRQANGITVFLPFQDPANIGAALRSAAAFGAARVVLLSEAASPYLPKAIRAASNAVLHTEILFGPSITDLLSRNHKIYRLDMRGRDIETVKFTSDVMLLPGIEGYGFKETGKSIPLTIPIAAGVESLNAQTALSIALYKIRRNLDGVVR